MDVHLVLFWFYTQNIELFEQRTKSKNNISQQKYVVHSVINTRKAAFQTTHSTLCMKDLFPHHNV